MGFQILNQSGFLLMTCSAFYPGFNSNKLVSPVKAVKSALSSNRRTLKLCRITCFHKPLRLQVEGCTRESGCCCRRVFRRELGD